MKIASWVRSQGKVPLLIQPGKPIPNLDGIEMAWISCVFKWNKQKAEDIANYLISQGVPPMIGGSGISLQINLPPNIEFLPPDYSLYMDDRAIGFLQRGCIRKCDFCDVSKKEGHMKDHPYNPLESWVPHHFEKVLLLDNEFAAFPATEHERFQLREEKDWDFAVTQKEIFETAKSHKWKLSITQGYDLRCVDEERASLLAKFTPWNIKFTERRIYCAWDYFGIEPYVKQGIELLLKHGIKGKEIMCYCLVGHKTSHLQDYFRFHLLWKKYEVLPFIMRFNLRKDDPFLNALARYCNKGPAIYRNNSFPEYCRERAPWVFQEAYEIFKFCESGNHPPREIPK